MRTFEMKTEYGCAVVNHRSAEEAFELLKQGGEDSNGARLAEGHSAADMKPSNHLIPASNFPVVVQMCYFG